MFANHAILDMFTAGVTDNTAALVLNRDRVKKEQQPWGEDKNCDDCHLSSAQFTSANVLDIEYVEPFGTGTPTHAVVAFGLVAAI